EAGRKGVNIEKELSVLKTMAGSDVVWDAIARIERVKPTSEYVYDLTVGGTETFTTFEGIVTHNTMRTYHFAGTAGIQVTLGLPRILEIFDARKEPRTPTMTVHINPEFQSLEQVKKIAENVKEIRAKDVIQYTTLDLTDFWIRCKLNMEKLKALEIDPEKLPKIVKIRNADVKVKKDEMTVSPKKKDMATLHKLKYSMLETHIKGIKGISQVVVTKEEGEWVINTLGSNLKKVFGIQGVDPMRTTSNDILEILGVLGVEAARNAIVEQSRYTMEEQGLNVDTRYIMLLADLMTSRGDVRAIGRYGISGQKASLLVRASFEETKKHLIAASIKGESDPLKGTVENIMMNQVAPIGTGAFSLVGSLPGKVKPKAVKKAKPKKAKPPEKAKK
ncbi:MAG: intein-containing DNA-directed RNA polymerase subunit A'', partial [Candidatus Aenigmatarchaeota archaeon]